MTVYRGFDADAFRLLAVSSVRRLLRLRSDPYARQQCKKWLSDLRALHNL